MGRGLGRVWVGLFASALAAGCSQGEAPAGSSPAPSVTVAAFDAPAYCTKVCKRSAGCGIEAAETIARGGSAADKAVLAEARTTQEAVEKACVDSCNARPPRRDEVDDARRAEACLQQPDCAALQTCLEKL